jgi:HD-like signal output (HDOD) protein
MRSILAGISTIPSLPLTYQKLLKLAKSKDSSLGDIGDVISEDAAMTARILQVVNSSYFTSCSSVSNTRQAATQLGLHTIKALVLAEGVFSEISFSGNKLIDLGTLKNNGIKVGALASEIAKTITTDRSIIDDAFQAGLMHDPGTRAISTILKIIKIRFSAFRRHGQQIEDASLAILW